MFFFKYFFNKRLAHHRFQVQGPSVVTAAFNFGLNNIIK